MRARRATAPRMTLSSIPRRRTYQEPARLHPGSGYCPRGVCGLGDRDRRRRRAAVRPRAAAAEQPAGPFAPWDGSNPFNCTIQNVGTGTDFPDPGADPFCVEFDKTQQNVTDLGHPRLPRQRAGTRRGGRGQVLLLPDRPLDGLGRPGRGARALALGRPVLLRQGDRRRRRQHPEPPLPRPARLVPARDAAGAVRALLRPGRRRRLRGREHPGRPELRGQGRHARRSAAQIYARGPPPAGRRTSVAPRRHRRWRDAAPVGTAAVASGGRKHRRKCRRHRRCHKHRR